MRGNLCSWGLVSLLVISGVGCTPTPPPEGKGAPVLQMPEPLSLVTGQRVEVTLEASDPDGDTLTFSLSEGAPAFATLEGAVLTLSPAAGDVGDHEVGVAVSDGTHKVEGSLAVTVAPADGALTGTVQLNGGAAATNTPTVTVQLTVQTQHGVTPTQLELSNDGTAWSNPEPFVTERTNWELSAGDGQKTVHARVGDSAGRRATFSATIQLDRTAPVITTAVLNGGEPFAKQASVALAVETNESGSGLRELCVSGAVATSTCLPAAPGQHTITLSEGDGAKTVQLVARDMAGNASEPFAATVTLDAMPPVLSAVTLEGGAAATNKTTIEVELLANDGAGSGLDRMAIAVDDAPFGPTLPFSAVHTLTLPQGDANRTVRVQAWDRAGHPSEVVTASIRVDTEPPTGGLVINPGNPQFTSSTAVTLEFPNLSGDATHFCTLTINNGNPAPSASCWEPIAQPTYSLPPGDGPKPLYVWFKDEAQNVSSTPAYDVIFLDQTPPVHGAIALNGGQPWARDVNVQVAFTGFSDVMSGVAFVEFSEDGTSFGPAVPFSNPATYTFSGTDGARTLWARAVDAAGNVGAAPYPSATVSLDRVAPAVTISVNGGNRYTQLSPVPVAIQALESGSGVSQMCLRVTNAGAPVIPPVGLSDACWTSFATPTPVAVNAGGNGDRRISVWVRDVAGNVSTVAGGDIFFDATPPPTPTAFSAVALHRKVVLGWINAADAHSGLAGFEVGIAPSSAGPFTYGALIPADASGTTTHEVPVPLGVAHAFVVRAVDNAGNRSNPTSAITRTSHRAFAAQQRLPTAGDLTAAAVGSNGAVIAVGEGGTVLTSDPGVTTFTARDPGSDGRLNGVVMHINQGFLVGNDGVIVQVTNNGQQLTAQANGQAEPRQHLRAVAYAGAPQQLLQAFVAVGDGGTILRTEGAFSFPAFQPVSSGTTAQLRAVARCSSSSGACSGAGVLIAVGGNGLILRSTDTGNTWTAVAPPAGYANRPLHAVAAMPGTNEIYIGGDPASGASALLRSIDGGVSFNPVNQPSFSDVDIYSMAAVGGRLFMGVQHPNNGRVLRLENGQRTDWITADGARPLSVVAPASNLLVTVGVGGLLQVSQDGGTTWTSRSGGASNNLRSIYVVPNATEHAFATGDQGTFLSTTNGGATWVQRNTGTLNPLRAVQSLNAQEVVAVGDAGTILRSFNRGGAFTTEASNVSVNLHGLSCRTITTCIAVGGSQTVLVSSASGWTVQATGGQGTHRGVVTYLAGGTTPRAIVVGDAGAIRLLNNTTWSTPSPVAHDLEAVAVKGDFNGTALAVGRAGNIYRSLDHGNTWTRRTSGTTRNLYAVAHGGGTTWYASGTHGVLLKSTDDGETWRPLQTNSERDLYGVTVSTADPNRVWTGGDWGTVLYSTTAGE